MAPAGPKDSYREGIFGSNFTATISGLPDGKYTIVVGMLAVHVSSKFLHLGEPRAMLKRILCENLCFPLS